MDFSEAFALMKKGGSVRRKEWVTGAYMAIINDKVRRTDGGIWWDVPAVDIRDMMADDWEEAVIKETCVVSFVQMLLLLNARDFVARRAGWSYQDGIAKDGVGGLMRLCGDHLEMDDITASDWVIPMPEDAA